MTPIATALPLLGLRITAGPVELRGVTDDLIVPLAEIAAQGIHDPDSMPFYNPWSLTPAQDMPRCMAQFHWGQRAGFSVEKWAMDLAVFWEGTLVGSQGFSTRKYLVTRAGETGSWLGQRFQGKGIGTAMRKVICAFVIDYLDAACVASAAYADNPASLAVSRKAGYTDNGWSWIDRMGKPARLRSIILEPANLVRYEHPLRVSGVEAFRRSVGLDGQGEEQPEG